MKKMKSNIVWSNVVAFIMMILAIAVGSLVIPWMLNTVGTSKLVASRLVVKWAIRNATRMGRKYENIRYSR